MVSENPIFLPMNVGTYKQNKITFLKLQLKRAHTEERIDKIHKIRKIGNMQVKLLKRLTKEIAQEYNKMIATLPDQHGVERKINQFSRTSLEKRSKIDMELLQIQEKLNALRM
jgi:hypothetical protein